MEIRGNPIRYTKSYRNIEDDFRVWAEDDGYDNRPVCPDCNAVMVKTHTEMEDFVMVSWACDCVSEYELEVLP